MDVSKDPKIIQYANTITGLPEYHVMKQALEKCFGENAKVSFENIEDTKKAIEEEYTAIEYGLLTEYTETTATEEPYPQEENKVAEKQTGPTPEEITNNLSKSSICLIDYV